jgi:hypothetical protein
LATTSSSYATRHIQAMHLTGLTQLAGRKTSQGLAPGIGVSE